MVSPRDPEAFRAEVLRRAMRIERRRRRLRVLVTVPVLVSALLAVLLVGSLRNGSADHVTADGNVPAGAGLTSEVVPIQGLDPLSVSARPDGSLWVLGRDERSARMTLGTVTNDLWQPVVALPAGARPQLIVSSANGAAWMTDPAGHRVLRVEADGTTTSFPTEAAPSAGGVLGGDRRFWFAEPTGDRLVAINDDGHRVPYPVPTGRHPELVALAPNGSVAYGASGADELGTVSPTGSVVEYALATADARVVALAPGPGPALWFAMSSENGVRLGRVSAKGTLDDEGALGNGPPSSMALGPDGRLWFSTAAERVVRQRSLARLTARPIDRTLDATSWALTPDGTMWAADRSTKQLLRISSD